MWPNPLAVRSKLRSGEDGCCRIAYKLYSKRGALRRCSFGPKHDFGSDKGCTCPSRRERGTQAKAGGPVFIKTSKSDKYDRYLVDVFITDKNGEEQYLNNLLLEEGLAVKVTE